VVLLFFFLPVFSERKTMSQFVFETGSFHPAKRKEFVTLAEVWGFVTSLRDEGKLVDVVCCDENGEILNPPYHNEQTPGLIEEKIDGSDQPRMWLLQIR
jgi:hypothetical protein